MSETSTSKQQPLPIGENLLAFKLRQPLEMRVISIVAHQIVAEPIAVRVVRVLRLRVRLAVVATLSAVVEGWSGGGEDFWLF